jgi:hypothetical protein
MIARVTARAALALSLGAAPLWVIGCMHPLRAAVSLAVVRHAHTPADATVTIDEEYIGLLGYVAAHGVRLPVGEHRITVERDGYFPFDTTVTAGREPIRLEIELVPVPD